MKRLLLIFALFLLTSLVNANDITIDPTIEGQKNFVITCDYPTERTDGTLLTIDEIVRIDFFVHVDSVISPAGSNDAECSQSYDATLLADGRYTYFQVAVDTEGRTSGYSDGVNVTIIRLSPPKSPTNSVVVAF